MKSGYVVALSIVAVFATKGLCVSGFAVSSVQVPCDRNGNALFYFGSIVKYTIQSDNVTRCDTIYKQFRATYPHLNLQGTMCAFLRRSLASTDSAYGPKDTATYVSVMDINGGNVHDLDTLRAWVQNRNPQSPPLTHTIDWPAGDYVYYSKQIQYGIYQNDGVWQHEIWRAKYNDPSSQTLVCKYHSLETWSLSLDGTRAGVTDISQNPGTQQNEFHCLPHAFPPLTPPTKAGWDSKVWVGCGTYISPSGKYHWHFFEGGHDNWRINTWNPPTELLATVDVASADFPAWSVDKSLTSETIGRGPMEWARWAVNSDKWICGCTNVSNMHVSPPVDVGHNQVLCNWIDHKVIVTSRNWQASSANCDKRHSDPGDMWIAGGPGGNTYEDVNGKWITVNALGVRQNMVPARSGAFTMSPKVNVYSVQGRLLGIWDRQTLSRALPAGTYFVLSVSGGRGIARLGISGKEVR